MISDKRVSDLFGSAKDGGAPSDDDRARIHGEIAAKLAKLAIGGLAAKSLAAKTAASTGGMPGIATKIASLGFGAKIALATIGTGMVAAMVLTGTSEMRTHAKTGEAKVAAPSESVGSLGLRARNDRRSTDPVPPPETQIAAAIASGTSGTSDASAPSGTIESPPPAVATAQTTHGPAAAPSASSPNTAPAPSAAALQDEIALIRRAKSKLEAGDETAALNAVGEYEHRFPAGTLHEEARVVHVLALCGAGRTDEGRALAASMQRSFAWDRMKSACAIP